MRISLITCGTRGDVQPMVVLGHELVRRGHEVVLGVSPNLVDWCERAGLTALPFGPDSEAFMRSPRGQDWLAAGDVRTLMAALSAEAHQHAATSRAQLGVVAGGADLIVAGLLAEDSAAVAAETADVPLVTLHSAPVRRTSACAAPLVTTRQLPGPVNRLTHRLFERVWWKAMRPDVAELRREWGLPPARTTTARWLAARSALELQAYSDLLVPALDDYGPRRPRVGFLTPTPALRAQLGEIGIDDELAAWLDDGEPPVYVGFGSMPITDPAKALRQVRAVCGRLGLRALVSAGWSSLAQGAGLSDSSEVKVVAGGLDHDAVLPRCSVAVHHGGAGTTAAAVGAGLPSLVCSVFADQPFWGERLRALGVGRHVPFAALDEQAFETGLLAALEPDVRQRAAGLGSALRAELGATERAADLVEAAATSSAAA